MPCKCENKSYLNSYEVSTELARKTNPSLSVHDVRVQVAQSFRLKYREWKTAEKIENSGKSDYKNGEFAFNEHGKMWYPKTGENAEGMHERQRILSELPGHTSDEYSFEDHQITRLVEATLHAGASRVVTAYGNRDLIEFNYDHATNRGFIRVFNRETDNFRTKDEIKQLAKQKFGDLHQSEPSKNIFVLSDKPLIEKVAKDTISCVQYAGKQTLREVKHAIASVRHYIERRNEKRQENSISENTPTVQLKVNRVNVLQALPSLKILSDKPKVEVYQDQKPLRRLRKRVVQHGITLMVEFASVKKIVEKPIELNVKKFIQNERKLRKRVKKLELRKQAFIPKEKLVEVKRGESMAVFAGKTWLRKRKEIKEIFSLKRIERKSKERVMHILSLVKKLIRIREQTSKIKVERMQKAAEQILNFSIAFVFWMLLLPKRYHVPLHDSKEDKRAFSERLSPKEPTLWILFAIIWYLAMIREMNLQTSQTQPKQKKVKKNAYDPYFAPQGVIFAYAT